MGGPTWCWCPPWRVVQPAPSPRAVTRPRRWHDGCHHDQPHRAGSSVGRSGARSFLFTNLAKFLIPRHKNRPATQRNGQSNPDKMLTLIVGCRSVGERAAADPIFESFSPLVIKALMFLRGVIRILYGVNSPPATPSGSLPSRASDTKGFMLTKVPHEDMTHPKVSG